MAIQMLRWVALAKHVSDAVAAVPATNQPVGALNNALVVPDNGPIDLRGARYVSLAASVAVGVISYQVYWGRDDVDGDTTWTLDTGLGVAGVISPVVGAVATELVVEAPGTKLYLRDAVNAGGGANTLTVDISAGNFGA